MKKRRQTISKRILNSNDAKTVTVPSTVAENSYKMNVKSPCSRRSERHIRVAHITSDRTLISRSIAIFITITTRSLLYNFKQNWRQNLALDLNQWFTYACRCIKIYLSDEYTSQFLEKKIHTEVSKPTTLVDTRICELWFFNLSWITKQLLSADQGDGLVSNPSVGVHPETF